MYLLTRALNNVSIQYPTFTRALTATYSREYEMPNIVIF